MQLHAYKWYRCFVTSFLPRHSHSTPLLCVYTKKKKKKAHWKLHFTWHTQPRADWSHLVATSYCIKTTAGPKPSVCAPQMDPSYPAVPQAALCLKGHEPGMGSSPSPAPGKTRAAYSKESFFWQISASWSVSHLYVPWDTLQNESGIEPDHSWTLTSWT